MKANAYSKQSKHLEMVEKTRALGWYKEELFSRFHIVDSQGSLLNLSST